MNVQYNKYCPYNNKYELVNWASQRFNRSKSYFNKMTTSRVYAIYYNC